MSPGHESVPDPVLAGKGVEEGAGGPQALGRPPVQVAHQLLQHLHRQLRQENHPFPDGSHCQLWKGQAVLSQIEIVQLPGPPAIA